MNPINEMTIQECIEILKSADGDSFVGMRLNIAAIADRIHELTRWIPVGERLPTEADADENDRVLWWRTDSILPDAGQWDLHSKYANAPDIINYTHWKRIDKP